MRCGLPGELNRHRPARMALSSRLKEPVCSSLASSFCSHSSWARFPSAPAQARRPITHEDVWLMKRVGAPVPSPDGKWVSFSVLEPAYDEKDQVSDIWIAPADGSAKPRRLTATRSAESGASPGVADSRRIAFSTRREGDEVNQIYVIDMCGGGEAVRVTSISTGARSPQWRPDGKAILFTSRVYPGALDDEANKKMAAERKARKYRARVFEGFPIRNWDRWLDELQTHHLGPGTGARRESERFAGGNQACQRAGICRRHDIRG